MPAFLTRAETPASEAEDRSTTGRQGAHLGRGSRHAIQAEDRIDLSVGLLDVRRLVEIESALNVEFLPEKELWRRFAAARRARAQELIAIGSSSAHARAQAEKEFSLYDRIEVDERGWIRICDLELPAPKPPGKRPARVRSPKRGTLS